MIGIALLLLAGSGFAQPYPGLPDTAYVGIFADEARTSHQVNYSTGPAAFQYYIFFLPNQMGFQAAEFKLSLPANAVGTSTVAKDPAITVELGTLTGGISVALAEGTCRTDWFYLYRLQSILMSAVQGQIMIVENPAVIPFPAYQVASCEAGYPIYPVKRFCHLSLNYDGGIGVENTSWGGIKSLF